MSQKDDDERFWNFMIFDLWMTDKEMEDAAPFILGSIAVILLLILAFWIFK